MATTVDDVISYDYGPVLYKLKYLGMYNYPVRFTSAMDFTTFRHLNLSRRLLKAEISVETYTKCRAY